MRRITGMISVLGVLAGLIVTQGAARANGSIAIRDDAHVLSAADQQNIQQAGQQAPFSATVWTVPGGFASKTDFRNAVNGLAGSDRVVIAVDVKQRWSHIASRQNTGLSSAQMAAARSAANQRFAARDWGGGMVAALSSLAAVAPNQPTPVGGAYNAPAAPVYQNSTTQPSSGGIGMGTIVLIIVVIGVFAMLARRLMGGRVGNRTMYGSGMPGAGINSGMVGGGMPGYGPNYGPNYGGVNQRGGVNPLVAGGLGAAGGGLLGYELGKMAGEREGQNQGYVDPNQVNMDPNAGNYGDAGGIVQSDTDTGNAPDFGSMDSGGADFSSADTGGADFGGGDVGGGDIGGGADF